MTAAIQLTDVTKAFGTHQVLDGVSLEVPAGSVYALLGTAVEPFRRLRR